MDLLSRIKSIENRLYKIETVSRLRSAAISEGITEFTEEGQLIVEDGGSFILNNGGAISGGSWELGANLDGTTYANVGDVLMYTHNAAPVSKYITRGSIPVSLDEPITRITEELPEGALYAVVIGNITVMAEDEIRSIVRLRSEDIDISMVILEGQTQSIPVMMKFNGPIEFEVHTTQSYSIDSSFEVIYQWEIPTNG